MKFLLFLSPLAVYFLFATKEEENSNLIGATAQTEHRTRLTASLHEEFVIFQCTLDSAEDLDPIQSTLRDQGNERSDCCDWIIQTASKLLDDGDDDDDEDDAAPSWTVSLCEKHLAVVPVPSTSIIRNATSSRSSRVDEPSQLATYMFLYPRRAPETANGFFPPTSSSTTDDAPTAHGWNHFVWLEETFGTGQWLVDKERRPVIPSVQDTTGATTADAKVQVSLTSTLSETGGMHREFHHVLQLGNVPQECQNYCTFSMWISLYLAADVFINTEDAFSSSSTSINNNHHPPSIDFQIYTADNGNERIDQEEPAFASPWHVVWVHLQGPVAVLDNSSENDDGTTGTATRRMMEWDTLLHLRYPSPVVEKDFARMHILAPQLMNGFLQSTDNTNSPTHWKMVLEPNDEFELYKQHQHPAVLSTWVAVAREEDYPWILGLTMAAATVGAAVMLRDISRVASWS